MAALAARSTPAALPARPLGTFGWALAGILGVAMSLPPVGFYPLAWIGLVPLLVRWSTYPSWQACAREVYALGLVLSTCSGFWTLFDAEIGRAVFALVALLAVPLPLAGAFVLAHVVRRRFGLAAGLGLLFADVLAAEYLALSVDAGLPWLLLGHTQLDALAFVQTAEIGGVLMLSAWVLLLNGTAFVAVPQRRLGSDGVPHWALGESGLSVALLAALVALPAVFGAVRAQQAETPSGFARLGVVQPGVAASTWSAQSGSIRVDHLAALSDRLLSRWVAETSAPGDSLTPATPVSDGRTSAHERWTADRQDVAGAALTRPGNAGGLLVWPRDALPSVGTLARQQILTSRLEQWCRTRGVALLAGAQTLVADGDAPAASALFVSPEDGIARRVGHVRAADTGAAPTLFTTGGAQVAALVGDEAFSGDLVRQHAAAGANLFVVLARSGQPGGSGGLAQDLASTRLRAIETRRAVVVTAASGATALVLPSGHTDRLAGWMEQGLIPIDAPTFREQTLYTRHGNWLGRGALYLGLGLHLGLALFAFRYPTPNRMRQRAKTFRGGVPVAR